MMSRRRTAIADALGLLALLLALLDYLPPSLLLEPTITAGGDTPCHYPTAVWLHEQLLPQLRLHGWYPGAYMGHPLLLYYFPLPFLVMSALAPAVGMPVAFKLGTVLGVFLLPLLTYVAFRWMGLRFPGPLLGAAAAHVFLLLEDNPIWGGTIASTLTGEFSYTYGIAFGVLFLGAVHRAHARQASPLVPGAVLALAAVAHGYAVLWAGLSASYFLFAARRPVRTLRWLLGVAGLAFGLAAFFLVPLLADWGWTTSYDDPWITVTTKNLVPPYLWPLLACAALGWLLTLALARRTGGPDHRLLFLAYATAIGAALAAAGPALGIIDVRFVPFAQLAGCLAGGAALGLVVQRLAAADLAALGLTLLAIFYADSRSRVVRAWVEWNYSGLESKELWPAWRDLTESLSGSVADPRVAVEYSKQHERAGSIRMYETLPLFSGRSTLEGVYNQASLQTHPVYYLASELGELSPNPFRKRKYSSFDTERALHHLRLYNVREIVALSDKLIASLEARDDVSPVASIPPYRVFRIDDPGPGYVEALAFEPFRSSLEGWRDTAYRWFARKPVSRAHLVFTDDPRFRRDESDGWLAPPELPLEPGVSLEETVTEEGVTIHTNRPGHPLLVKISYHPRWRAEGADGPYLVSPALMMVVPKGETVRLHYARTRADAVGWLLTATALGFYLWRLRRRSPAGAAARLKVDAEPARVGSFGWGGVIPVGLLLALAVARFLPGGGPDRSELFQALFDRASQAYADGRFGDAAEYAQHALDQEGTPDERAGVHCLRGESLLRDGRFAEAESSFDAVLADPGAGAYGAQAWSGLMRAREAAGNVAGAAQALETLASEYPDTPWAQAADPNGAGEPEP